MRATSYERFCNTETTLTPTSLPRPSVLANPVWNYWPNPAVSVCGPWVLPLDTALYRQRTLLKRWQPGTMTSATGTNIPSIHNSNTIRHSAYYFLFLFNRPWLPATPKPLKTKLLDFMVVFHRPDEFLVTECKTDGNKELTVYAASFVESNICNFFLFRSKH